MTTLVVDVSDQAYDTRKVDWFNFICEGERLVTGHVSAYRITDFYVHRLRFATPRLTDIEL